MEDVVYHKSNLPDPAVGTAEYIPSSLLNDVVFMLAILFAYEC